MTNPTERPEERGLYEKYYVERTDDKAVGRVFVLEPEEDEAARRALSAYAEAIESTKPNLASDLRRWLAALSGSTRMTERPEERDSLAEIEKRLAASYSHGRISGDPEWSDGFDWAEAMRDLRTLINEVKERDKTNALLRDLMAAQRESIDEYLTRITALEAEVNELREENARLIDATDMSDPHRCRTQILALEAENKTLRDEMEGVGPPPSTTQLREAVRRIKQMEEALREVLPLVVVRNGQGDRAVLRAAQLLDALDGREALHKAGVRNAAGAASPELTLAAMKRVDAARDAARAALSPSDTEEPR